MKIVFFSSLPFFVHSTIFPNGKSERISYLIPCCLSDENLCDGWHTEQTIAYIVKGTNIARLDKKRKTDDETKYGGNEKCNKIYSS